MTPEPLVLLSALEHHLYCPRQCALIHVDGLWSENRATIAGVRSHRRVDTQGGRVERGRIVIRALPLYSDRYGLVGRADGIEIHDDGTVVPVEHKAGVRHGQTADVQLCAQALCLEDMFGRPVTYGFVWYGGTRRRRRIELDETLRALTLDVVDQIRAALVTATLPPPVADGRCRACQLEPVCMPDVVIEPERVQRYLDHEVLSCP
jgi:CRISPR-associated exonuclease Cas4